MDRKQLRVETDRQSRSHGLFQSFGFGRPPSMSLAFIDCEYPKDLEERVTEEGHKIWGCEWLRRLHNHERLRFRYSPSLDMAVHQAPAHGHHDRVRHQVTPILDSAGIRSQDPRLPDPVQPAA